eukprot:scaffold14049_cov190-Isochrysis_galbana.AAC.3
MAVAELGICKSSMPSAPCSAMEVDVGAVGVGGARETLSRRWPGERGVGSCVAAGRHHCGKRQGMRATRGCSPVRHTTRLPPAACRQGGGGS